MIEDPAENAFLSAEARATGTGVSMFDGWWIGLRDLTPTGTSFTWVDGTPLGYDAWATGQPNDPPSCGRIWPMDDEWADLVCGRSIPYFCELSPPP